MNPFVAGYLAQDGLANGAIYALLAIALIAIFSVTRIIFVALGELVSYAAMTYVAMLEGSRLGVIAFVGVLAMAGALRQWSTDAGSLGTSRALAGAVRGLVFPLAACLFAFCVVALKAPTLVMLAAAVLLVTAMGPVLYRLVYAPIAGASILVLLIVSIAVHLALLGMGLYFFGPQGGQTPVLIDGAISLGRVPVKYQSILIIAVTLIFMVGLFFAAEKTLFGKAMRAAAFNPVGARLMGVSASLSGETAFTVAAFIAASCGVLISSITTMYYDTGFLLALKGFVAAICGGLANFPAAVVAAALLGLLESFSSFFASAFKETIVFSLTIPALLWLSLARRSVHEDEA